MTHDAPPTRSMAPTPPSAWQHVSDSLLAGLAHALSNRAAAIGALAAFAEAETVPDALGETLGTEAERLEDLVRLLRLLGQDGAEDGEPVQVAALMRDVLALHSHHRDLRGVRFDVEDAGAVHPVRGRRCALVRAVLLLLALAARSGIEAGHRRLAVRWDGDGQWVRLIVAPRPGGEELAPAQRLAGSALQGVTLPDVRQAAVEAGGDAEEGGMPAELEMRFPTLAESRRRDRHLQLV